MSREMYCAMSCAFNIVFLQVDWIDKDGFKNRRQKKGNEKRRKDAHDIHILKILEGTGY